MGSIGLQSQAAVLSSNRCEPGSFPLVTAQFPAGSNLKSDNPHRIAAVWVSDLNKCLSNPSKETLSDLFLVESYWRDQLCLTWDFHTLSGPSKIHSLLQRNPSRIKSISLDESTLLRAPTSSSLDDGKVQTVQAFLKVETDVGSGQGFVRLIEEKGRLKAFTLFTFLKELKGHEEATGKKRPFGVKHGEHDSQENWADRRKKEESFDNGDEPTVLIVGAGQGGLTVAARLKMLGIKSLIIDRQERIGDNWRSRYHKLVLHDCVWFDHLPYMPFPEYWPVFTPKDKLGDWFESYVKLLELNAWTRTTLTNSSWDDVTAQWTVNIERIVDGKPQTRVLHPKHIIQATGASGEPNMPDIKGMSKFTGTRLIHSSAFAGASPSHGQNKKAVVVGCCNSAHDIAQDLYENGYSVTMVQRSTTMVLTCDTNLRHMAGLYGEDAPPTDDADVMFMGVPNAVTKKMNMSMTDIQANEDSATLSGLEKAGFRLDRGPDGSGLWIKYLQRGGGYYIDVGCSQLIIDGNIKVKSGSEISEVTTTGLLFEDGERIDADEIIFATGYLNMRTQCRKIFGYKVADRVKDVWGFDEEGEIRTLWRDSGHPGFWFMGGNLALCRWYSRLLALQIKGQEEGLMKRG
ncbi:related to monooxygenase [Rhynchosporium agropyri]|uniref:Related to monooxygenase n=1 Tax=Rhynchosporium agropyri TaxID=914238 RepID=A0A1E1JRN4_9HELO|nr:related to monooxygenase [Rhynchosporium agropyri]